MCRPFDDDRVAVITKMHHALADGVAANALLANIVDGLASDPAGPCMPSVSQRGRRQSRESHCAAFRAPLPAALDCGTMGAP